jgi:glutamate-1-semialdehyde 2,1-aminomutase
MAKGSELYQHAQGIIPGGTQLLSKRPQMFLPDGWPAYYSRCKGARVWDLDGNEYIDASHFGVGAPVLGYADPEVDQAVMRAVASGTACTLNCPEEVALADLLVEIHPWAEMVRLARGGGEALSIAARIVRAAAGRETIAVCGYHGWCDWYLAANLADDRALDGHLLPGLHPAGVPRGLKDTILTFAFNDLAAADALFGELGDKLAAVVMEPMRSSAPQPGFLEGVRRLCNRDGVALVFDEVTSGWRIHSGGAHMVYGVQPDMAVFAKATGNGYPISAVIGRRALMDAAQSTFISSTAWTERIGPAAALATIGKHRRERVPEHLVRVGRRVQEGWRQAAASAGIEVSVAGVAPLCHLGFARFPDESATLFTQLMLDRGYLAGSGFYVSYAHTEALVDTYLEEVERVFRTIREVAESGGFATALRGPVRHTGFRRLS